MSDVHVISDLDAEAAEALEKTFLQSLKEAEEALEKFVAGRGWLARGFSSLLAWWDATVRECRLGPAVRAIVVYELQKEDPDTGRKLTDRETAQRVGVTEGTVRKDTGRKIKSAENSAKSIKAAPSPRLATDDSIIDGEIIDDPEPALATAPDDPDDDPPIDPRLEVKHYPTELPEVEVPPTAEGYKWLKRTCLDLLTHPDMDLDVLDLIEEELLPQLQKDVADARKRLSW